jgi:Mg2+ and Co2+ transporter CorA
MKTPLAFLLTLLMAACAPSPQKKVEVLQQEVLALHDSAMAKMGILYTGRKQLTYLKDSVVTKDTAAQQQLAQQINALVQADEHMMQWMRAYRNPDGKQPEEALLYLQTQKAKIEQVRQEIEITLKVSDSLAALYSTPKP